MTSEQNMQYYDVVGPGYVPEHHADQRHHFLATDEWNALSGAIAWLVFYVIAVVVALASNIKKAATL
jgi:hypothetical protein